VIFKALQLPAFLVFFLMPVSAGADSVKGSLYATCMLDTIGTAAGSVATGTLGMLGALGALGTLRGAGLGTSR
jgi:hypothetical protein